ncbi:Glycogen operon protein GlgX [Streptomyces tendae]
MPEPMPPPSELRNLLTTLLLSTGVPMLVAGDEMGRTQRGSNNAYCQDNETSWVDWSLRDDPEWAALFALASRLIALRHRHPVLRRRAFFSGRAHSADGLRDLAAGSPGAARR